MDDDPVPLTPLKRSYRTFLGFDKSSEDLERSKKVALKTLETAKEDHLDKARMGFDNANIVKNRAIVALQEATKIVKEAKDGLNKAIVALQEATKTVQEAAANVKAAKSRLTEATESCKTAKSGLNQAKQDYTKASEVLKNAKTEEDDGSVEERKCIIQLAEQEIQLEQEKNQQKEVFLDNKNFEIEDEDDVKAITYMRPKTGWAGRLRISNRIVGDQKQKLVDQLHQEGFLQDDEA